MNREVKITLSGLMIWVIGFLAGGIGFFLFDIHEENLSEVLLIGAIKSLFLGIGWALALFFIYKDKGQDYKRTGWEAGITWYATLLLMDLIVLVGLLGLKLEVWFPSIFIYSTFAIVTISIGYLIAGSQTKN